MIVFIYHISLYLLLVYIFALSLFCYGFFPLSFSPSTKSSIKDIPGSLDSIRLDTDSYKPHNSRAVLMVIDALRCDFVTQRTNMPFLNKLIEDGRACQYQLEVHPPTVTMPRIKAMTSGAIPSFLDVILNLGSPQVTLDTFLYQMVQLQRRIVFYGDNTWTNMFPDLFTRKGENVDSLYVNDFYEGDRNITNNMRLEIRNYDWKLMILHYLGLDHIGHVEGPFSDKVPGKLKEMDGVIEEIHEAMKIWDEKFHSKSLLVITGDHGMRDSGGHGGSTHPETHVPIVMLGNNCSESNAENFLQIDLAPTFAVLMGVAIPYSSIGAMIDPMLNHVPPLERIYATYYNTKRLIEKASVFYGNQLKEQDFFTHYKEAKLLHSMYLEHQDDSEILQKALDKYSTASRNLSRILIRNYILYDIPSIVMGIVICILTTGLSALLCIIPYQHIHINLNFKFTRWLVLVAAGLFSKYYLKIIIGVESNILQNTFFNHALFVITFTSITIHWCLLDGVIPLLNKSTKLKLLKSPGTLLLVGSVFHMLSLSSSSFVEEEHQTWYFFNNSWFLLITVIEFRIINRTIRHIKEEKANEVLLLHCRRERDEFCISAGLFFVGHILLRRWNQTGDKWQHMPDIGDWLGKEENKFWLSVILLFGLVYLFLYIIRFCGFLTGVLSMMACMLVYYYRAMTGIVSLWNITPSKTNSCINIFWINLLEILLIGLLPKLYRTVMRKSEPKTSKMLSTVICLTALLSAMIHKPHNVVLVASILSTSQYLVKRIDHIAESKAENSLLKIITHVWLGKMFYFYQGNSNNLATVDLNAGYVGLSSFNFTRVGLFLTLNTFNGQILSFLLLIYHLVNGVTHEPPLKSMQIEQSGTIVKQSLLKLLGLVLMVPLTFYTIVVALMRNHIFVWTVFSPKIIYDCFYTLLVFIQFLIISFNFG
ncbi:GPI ethanolamine phosphate transferase 2 isoform X2 [Armigeres subalbatus]|uniref:GPI ethanolamine phosphate transferase 2 isoform X2 n=1 Tax=Armigeres subalbatus TaxID=124917 RepID=UPI002ED1842E